MHRVIRQITQWSFLVFSLTLVLACAGPKEITRPITPTSRATKASAMQRIPGVLALEAARSMLGVPYRYGGVDPSGFDCSGLMQYAFNQAGVKLPRTSRDIFRISQLISPEDLQPGDLVFFAISSNKVSHVGIYADHNRFIHAPSSGKGVCYASLDNSYWRQRLVAVGRF